MSTILTALKKSQQQRDRGSVPGLNRTPDPIPTPRRRPRSWWMGGALALNGAAALAALVWWLGGSLGSDETAAGTVAAVAAPAPVELQLATSERMAVSTPRSLSSPSSPEPRAQLASPAPQVTAPEPASPQITTPEVAAVRPDPQPVAAAQPAPRPVAEATPQSTQPITDTGGQEAAPTLPASPPAEPVGQKSAETPPRAASAKSEPQPASVPQTEAEDPDPAPPVTRALAQAMPQPEAALPDPAPPVTRALAQAMPQPEAALPDPAPPVTSALAQAMPQPEAALPDVAPPTEVQPAVVVSPKEPFPEPEPDPYAFLPSLHQLSYSIQTALPDLSILVHVYGEDPQDRFVIIQRQKYREGDQLGSHLNLEAVTPSGAVLRYRDTSFRITR